MIRPSVLVAHECHTNCRDVLSLSSYRNGGVVDTAGYVSSQREVVSADSLAGRVAAVVLDGRPCLDSGRIGCDGDWRFEASRVGNHVRLGGRHRDVLSDFGVHRHECPDR